jgi:endonuclease YncB( thermonuclease family)
MSSYNKLYNYKIHKLLKVVDGDTIDVVIDLGFDIHVTKRIRLYGIDAPESRTRNKEEKVRGLAAKARLKELLDKKQTMYIESFGEGKFGRLLAKIFVGEYQVDVIDLMITEGHGEAYYGGSRK